MGLLTQLADASSMMSTLAGRSNARAMQNSWRCPTLKFSPPFRVVLLFPLSTTADESDGRGEPSQIKNDERR
jgi:hypothetical protein